MIDYGGDQRQNSMAYLKIIGFCTLAAIFYGIVHDQITARICVEYFTIGHEPIFGTDNPTILALGWGFMATWWMGFGLGVPAAFACRAGNSRPKLPARRVLHPIFKLLGFMAFCAAVAGLIGFLLASAGLIHLYGPISREIPASRHIAFLTDLWAHNASYLSGFLGGVYLIGAFWRLRGRLTPGSVDRPAQDSPLIAGAIHK